MHKKYLLKSIVKFELDEKLKHKKRIKYCVEFSEFY